MNLGITEAGRELVDKVARNAYRVTDEDVAAARAAGLVADPIFELCVCAAKRSRASAMALEAAFD